MKKNVRIRRLRSNVGLGSPTSLYIQIQKPGRAVGLCITPLKIKDMEKMSVTIAAAVWASGIAAIMRWAKLGKQSMLARVSPL